MVARVVVDHCRGRRFDYAVPVELRGDIRAGARVRIPFGTRDVLGTVVEMPDGSDVDAAKLKAITSLVSQRAELSDGLFKLVQWLARYYCCPEELAFRTALPQVVRKAQVTHKTVRFVSLRLPPPQSKRDELRKRAPKQLALIEALEAAGGSSEAGALIATASSSNASLAALVKAGFVAIRRDITERDPHAGEIILSTPPLPLNEAQKIALDLTHQSLTSSGPSKPILLYGVTGSGKTEVYLQALAKTLELEKDAIVLVPEISLTPQTVERFRSRFQHAGVGVAVLHSHLSEGERHDEWHRIHSGRARIVIGARSAVFAPVTKLGLLVVDEEHEPSYKQEEAPRYNARDVAVMRAHIEHATVVLGSATPSLESWNNAMTGKYQLASLPERADNAQLPFIRVVDMREETLRQKGFALISNKLRNAIEQRIERREQTILFLNRRGYASSLLCPICGHVCSCTECSVALTLHRAANKLVCHFCGRESAAPSYCPACSKPDIRFRGAGTERVEDVIQKLFPKAVIKRMDADSMSRKGSYREVLGAFRTGKIDILIGTQMIAKGLHFPNVTLVGIINADVALHLADFRAAERTFQLLVQVAGRAGRGDVAGEVFIQSHTPFHPAIQFARHHDFAGFVEQESEFRRTCGYPPFEHLVLLTIQSINEEAALFTAQTLHREISKAMPESVRISDVAPAPIARLRGEFRYQFMLRGLQIVRISDKLREIVEINRMPDGARLSIDVDALQLL
jgi:primosomal protein N' (replication factor Y)